MSVHFLNAKQGRKCAPKYYCNVIVCRIKSLQCKILIRYASPVQMRNEWSTIRIQHKVPGSMLEKKIAVGIPLIDKMGKKTVENRWMHHVDWQVEQQFSEYKNNALAFGRSNRNKNGEYMNIGKSGNVIKTGAGLFEQMEVANTMYYNTFSLKLIEDALYELSAAKLGMGDRYFVIKTGERGLNLNLSLAA